MSSSTHLNQENQMKINKYVKSIVRKRPYRPNKTENFRFDMAERSTNYSENFFADFLSTLSQEDFITYPSHKEYDNLRKKIANYHGFDYENIFLAAGSGACIESLMHVVANSESNIISSFPCFPMYFVYSDCYESNFKKVQYENNNIFSVNKIIEEIDNKTSLVILANPNSPYGDFKESKELEELCMYTLEKNITFLIDEAYVEFAPGNCLKLINKYKNVLVSRTFSKAWGAAGIRIGYLIGEKSMINNISNVQQAYPISGPSLRFAEYLLENDYEVKTYSENTVKERNKACQMLKGTNLYDVFNSHTNFIHIHERTGKNENLKKVLDESGIAYKFGAVMPGDDRKTWVRLSIGPNTTSLPFFRSLL